MVVLGVGDGSKNVVSTIVLTMILNYANMVIGLLFGGSSKLVQTFASDQKFYGVVVQMIQLVSTLLAVLAPLFKENVLYVLILGKVFNAI